MFLIGDGSPTFLGMGDARGAATGARMPALVIGVRLSPVFVIACSEAASGTGRMESEPCSIAPVYWPSAPGTPACAPRGFGDDVRPFPLST